MKHTLAYLSILCIALGLAACAGSEKPEAASAVAPVEEEAQQSVGPRVASLHNIDTSADGFDITTEVKVDSSSVANCAFDEYYDNLITLHVMKDSTSVVNHTFSKNDFRGDYDASKSVLVGMIYKERKEGVMVFAVEVGDPDNEEGGANFILRVDNAGAYTVTVDNTQDTSHDGE